MNMVATSLLSEGKLWEGVQLLVLTGKVVDACSYLALLGPGQVAGKVRDGAGRLPSQVGRQPRAVWTKCWRRAHHDGNCQDYVRAWNEERV